MTRLTSILGFTALLVLTSLSLPMSALAATDLSVLGAVAAQGNPNRITNFFSGLFSSMQVIGVAIGVLMAGWAGIKIATGQRDGMEKLVYAGIGVFILLMAKPIMDMVQAATR